MKYKSISRGAILFTFGLLLTGCGNGEKSPDTGSTAGDGLGATEEAVANRGELGANSCAIGEQVPVDGLAAYAIYADKDGNLLNESASVEDLAGTDGNKMCPTPALTGNESDPGACPAGYCARKIAGKTYCLRC